MDKDEALKLALEALENSKEIIVITQEMGIRFGVPARELKLGEVLIQDRAITAIKQALAAPVQEPSEMDLQKCWVEKSDGTIDGIAAMRLAIRKYSTTPPAQPALVKQAEQEPVAWHFYFGNEDEPNYAEIATPNAKPHEPRAVIRPLIFGDKNPPKLTNKQKIDMTEEFNKWWNEDDLLSENNPYSYGSPVCWAWEGWCAALAVPKHAVAWEGMTKNKPHAGAPKMIFTDKKRADEWLSGFTADHAWLEPMYK
jgi:hypothetical protein